MIARFSSVFEDSPVMNNIISSDKKAAFMWGERREPFLSVCCLNNDPGKVDSNLFCYAATVLSPHSNVLIFTQRMHKPT